MPKTGPVLDQVHSCPHHTSVRTITEYAWVEQSRDDQAIQLTADNKAEYLTIHRYLLTWWIGMGLDARDAPPHTQ